MSIHARTTPVIVAAQRTATGTFSGTLSNMPAHQLGAPCIKALVQHSGIDPATIDEVIVGQILTAGEGQNPARQAAMHGGIPQEVPSISINKLCGSGMKAIHYAAQSITLGDASAVLAGGQENMSMAPHLLLGSRNGQRMGDWKMIDSMVNDALSCAFHRYHMGMTAENIAKKYSISREAQDEYALASQQKASAAQQAGIFDEEIVPVAIPQRKGDPIVFDADEYIRHGLTIDQLAKMRPAFDTEGSVTPGNASGINDGAAMLLVMSEERATQLGLEPMARIVSWAAAGVDPAIMGTGPIPATQKCLERAGWNIDQLDLIESNEAFAVQSLAVNQELGWDISKVNVNGGAIALGHPVGASGARILTTLLHQMKRSSASKGLATMCIGGGQGIAITLER